MWAGAVTKRARTAGADVGGDALALVEELHGARRQPRIERGVHELEGRRVVLALELDVVVDVDAHALPLGIGEALGGQRLERRAIEALEELAAALPVAAHHAGVELGEQLGDARVQLGEREERLVAQPRQDPALDHLHGDLDLGLVARLRRAAPG